MAQLSQAPPEHLDADRGACEESRAEGQFSEHTRGETHVPTVAEEPNLEVLGSTAAALGTESNPLSFQWALGGRVYTKTGNGYYYDLEGVRYRHSGEEGQYIYEQVASVFEADDDRVSSPVVDAMVSKAIDYVTTDTPPRSPTPQSCSSYMIVEYLCTRTRRGTNLVISSSYSGSVGSNPMGRA
jgi:hypothetical protein